MSGTDAALASGLVSSLEREQNAAGLFGTWQRRAGRRETIETSPFATTFVAHALARAAGASPPDLAARVEALLARARAGLRQAPDANGRVRFLGPGSTIRPDVDDTACVWLALGDAGEACPTHVLDAVARAALPSGGFANDFDLSPPHAVELASSASALALLHRFGRDAGSAVAFVETEARRVAAGEPRGFFFPSGLFATFVVVRAAVDLGCDALVPAARALAAWAAERTSPEAPRLERAWALWILEATGGDASLRRALREAAAGDAARPAGRDRADDDAWFVGDPRAVDCTGLVVLGSNAARDAVLLDAWLLPEMPHRRLPPARPRTPTVAGRAGGIRRVERADGVTRFEVDEGGASHVLDVVPDGPAVDAYRRDGGFAVRYRGRDPRAQRAADRLIDSGVLASLGDAAFGRTSVDERATTALSKSGPRCLGGAPIAPHAPPSFAPCGRCLDAPACDAPRAAELASRAPTLRPRLSDEPLADALRFLAVAGFTSEALLLDLAALRAATSIAGELEVELSFKVRGDELVEGPRFTLYQHRPDTRRVLDAFATLAGGDRAAAIAARVAAPCAGLPLHLGVVHGPNGRAVKLYARTDGAEGERAAVILAAAEPGLSMHGVDARAIHGVGLALRGDALRSRVYVTVPSARVTDDPRADRLSLEGWDLSAEATPAREARYVHYRAARLSWTDACALADLGPTLAAHLARGLDAAGRWYVRFFGLPERGEGRSLYVTLGPRVPRATDDGP